MKSVIRRPWLNVIVWAVVTLAFIITMPDINKIVRLKGEPKIGENYPSQVAAAIEKEYQGYSKDKKLSTVAVVFYSKNGFSNDDIAAVRRIIDALDSQKEKYHILDISTHFKNPELKSYYVSSNNKVILASLHVDKSKKEIIEIRDEIYELIDSFEKPRNLEVYLTGGDLITQDFIKASQDGVRKTDAITILFIIIVLVLVFRSPVTPIVSILTVGVSFLVSLSIVGHLADKFNFPISTFTRTFIVVSLFGIGTDYNLLIISRFREELANGKNVDDAILTTYKTAGKTVIFSCLTVFAGFSAFAAATFNFFKAMTAIAISVLVLLLVLLTLVPAVLKIFGKNLLWPFNKEIKHTYSRLWESAAHLSTKYPYVVLTTVAILCIPFLLSVRGDLSFNTLNELSEKYKSVKGFNLISQNFSVGKTFPVTIYLKSDSNLATSDSLSSIEKISDILSRQKGIKEVYSVTRPQGKVIEEFTLSKQADTVIKGVDSLKDGLLKVNAAIEKINKNLNVSAEEFDVQKLISGLSQLENGLYNVKTALEKLNDGFEKGLDGSKKVYSGLAELSKGSSQLSKGFKEFYSQYTKSINGVKQKIEGFDFNQVELLVTSIKAVNQNLKALSNKYPELSKDINYLMAAEIVSRIENESNMLISKVKEFSSEYEKISGKMSEADKALRLISSSIDAISAASEKLATAQGKIVDGYVQIDNGQKQLISGTQLMYSKLKEFGSQKDQILKKVDELQTGLSSLKSGLLQISSALNKMANSLQSFKSYFEGYKTTNIFYVPPEALKSSSFKKALDSYMDKSRTITKIILILDTNPYTNKAIDIVDSVEKVLKNTLEFVDTKFTAVGVGGISSSNNDLRSIYFKDFKSLRLIMIISILILMFLISRSIFNAAAMVIIVFVDYYLALSITEMIFKGIFKYEALNWAVPFFTFVVFLALGIDYSVFLLIRFYEYRNLELSEALKLTSANIGHVVTSAVIILAGTFAAMLPSGILTLMQVSICVVIGLVLLAFFLLPFLYNSLMRIKRDVI
ncbi:MmpL domain-containing protein [Caldicellulosiruptor hydrothermalis 108]|uniref:MmpL domain-containing protein n=1 Tax=Caldicellulosiruptor hydrothermalis (strain DSM 18901 / VKM B-2411 / 108) TaxID=632292 RepID=E4QD20_CALH1|nr:MMPL family transporter [Caldicellulosiruptor hydrothermalis]ADQ07514.1 MmpL domain-containing protein [Caldicellulosiruptor hydrothermalis 108]